MDIDATPNSTPVSAISLLGPPLQLKVRMPDGGVLSPPAMTGERVTDLLIRFGIPLRQHRGEAFGECHALVTQQWRNRSGATEDGLVDLRELVMTPDLDGLELALLWSALVPQTTWVAG